MADPRNLPHRPEATVPTSQSWSYPNNTPAPPTAGHWYDRFKPSWNTNIESDAERYERERLEFEYKQRTEKRRMKIMQEEHEEEHRRHLFELEMLQKEHMRQIQRIEHEMGYRESVRNAEKEKAIREQEIARSLEEQRRILKSKTREEIEARRAEHEEHNQEMSENLEAMKVERLRDAEIKKRQLERLREETREKVRLFDLEQEQNRLRREREEAELKAELERMDAENREARERQKQMWNDRMRKLNEQFEHMMKLMAHRQWTMTMKRNFDARLNFYRLAGKSIQRKFERFTQSLLTFQEHLQRSEKPEEIRSRPVILQAEELRSALLKQKNVLEKEISNLENMYKKTSWEFLIDIEKSLEKALKSCEDMLNEIENNYWVKLNADYIKNGNALAQMVVLFDQISAFYSQIPTMDSLERKHGKDTEKEEGSSSSQKEEHQTDDGQVFFIEEPED